MYLGFRSECNFTLASGNRWSFFASFLASSCLASSCFLEGSSGERQVFHDLSNEVMSRRAGGREDFATREDYNKLSKGAFKW